MDKLINTITLGEWQNYIDKIPEKSIDCIITDPPYNVTSCKWDIKIDLDEMFLSLNRVIKDKGAIIIFSTQPFATDVINSNRKYFKYEWIWDKVKCSNYQLLRFQPGRIHENILVFSKSASSFVKNKNKNMNYFPIKTVGKRRVGWSSYGHSNIVKIVGKCKNGIYVHTDKYYPKTIIQFSNADNSTNRINSTQKPLLLIDYLVKTYTQKDNLILDIFSGSGTTACSCKKLKRNFICFEKEEEFYRLSIERLNNIIIKKELFNEDLFKKEFDNE